MENSFLKRFHGRFISMDTPDLLDFSVPINKALKPTQLYSANQVSPHKYSTPQPKKSQSTKASSNGDSDILPKIKKRSFSPYPVSTFKQSPFKRKSVKISPDLISLNDKYQFKKIINQPSPISKFTLNKRLTNLNQSYNLDLEFPPLEENAKQTTKKNDFEFKFFEPSESPILKNQNLYSIRGSPMISDYGGGSEREGYQYQPYILSDYKKTRQQKYNPFGGLQNVGTEEWHRINEKRRKTENFIKDPELTIR